MALARRVVGDRRLGGRAALERELRHRRTGTEKSVQLEPAPLEAGTNTWEARGEARIGTVGRRCRRARREGRPSPRRRPRGDAERLRGTRCSPRGKPARQPRRALRDRPLLALGGPPAPASRPAGSIAAGTGRLRARRHQDLLLVTSADLPLVHHIFLPADDVQKRPYTSSLPYRAGADTFLVGALPNADSARPEGKDGLDRLDRAAAWDCASISRSHPSSGGLAP